MITLAGIVGGVGGVLLLVGLIGGGFEFSGSVMPKVGGATRVLCFAVGGTLLVVAVVLAFLETSLPAAASPPPAPSSSSSTSSSSPSTPSSTSRTPPPSADTSESWPSPFRGYVLVGAGYEVHVFELPETGSSVVTSLPDGAAVDIVCTVQGESVTSPTTGMSSSLWNGTTAGGFLPDVMVDTGTNQAVMPSCLD